MAEKPDFSITHSLGRVGALSLECFDAGSTREMYVIAFGGQRAPLTPVDLDNYIAEITRLRDQARARRAEGAR